MPGHGPRRGLRAPPALARIWLRWLPIWLPGDTAARGRSDQGRRPPPRRLNAPRAHHDCALRHPRHGPVRSPEPALLPSRQRGRTWRTVVPCLSTGGRSNKERGRGTSRMSVTYVSGTEIRAGRTLKESLHPGEGRRSRCIPIVIRTGRTTQQLACGSGCTTTSARRTPREAIAPVARQGAGASSWPSRLLATLWLFAS